MKIAILTITDGQNYGNRLQNYAMQSILSDLGYEVETVPVLTSRDISAWKKFEVVTKDCIKRMLGRKRTGFCRRCRERNFKQFNKRYIAFSKYRLGKKYDPRRIADDYSFFVCGSDQIWNARFQIISENLGIYLASFAKPGKRVAYAASFGSDSVPDEYVDQFASQLQLFKAVGVREAEGKSLVKELSGRDDAEVVLDPTLLIPCSQWERSAKKPRYISDGEKYVFTYFLGGRKENMREYIKTVCKEYNAVAVNYENEFLDDDSCIEDKDAYASSPDNFIWMVMNSECILTDSFHATVFAILFHKPFVVFGRHSFEKDNNMNSRIINLLEKFNLFSMWDDIDNPNSRPEEMDENMIDEIERTLKAEREKSMDFLKKALDD